MKQLRYWSVKIVCGALGLLLGTTSIVAQSRYKSTINGVKHFITLDVQAGEATTLLDVESNLPIRPALGLDAQLGIGYELQKNKFFFSVGARATYDLTRNKIKDYTESFLQMDYENEPVLYRYHYVSIKTSHNILMLGVPVQFGVYITPQVYMAAGVRAEYPLVMSYKTGAQIYTDGVYDQYIQPIENDPKYGYYPKFPLSYSGARAFKKMYPMVTPGFEVGARFRLKKRTSVRVGAYVEYGFPLGAEYKLPFIDYSLVDQTPGGRSLEDLQQNLIINSELYYEGLSSAYNRLAVGVKATFLFQLKQKQPCVTCVDDSGIAFKPKRSKKK